VWYVQPTVFKMEEKSTRGLMSRERVSSSDRSPYTYVFRVSELAEAGLMTACVRRHRTNRRFNGNLDDGTTDGENLTLRLMDDWVMESLARAIADLSKINAF